MLHSILPTKKAAPNSQAALKLFNEALFTYLHALSNHHLLTQPDKDLILLAAHGLTKLHSFPLAKALIQMCFSYLTSDELLHYLDCAHQTQRALDCNIPF